MTAESRPDVDVCSACADGGATIPVHAHSRDGDRFDFHCALCCHRWQVVRTPQELKPPQSHAAVHRARTALRQVALNLGIWHRGPSADSAGQTYVKAGRDTVARIDEALAALHSARASLITELRRDEDLRAVRVDAMLADRRTPDTTTATGDPAPVAAEQAHIN